MEIAETRRRSAALFGNEKVVEVVLALDAAPDRQATAQQLATQTGVSHGMVRDVLVRLTKAGALASLPKVGGTRAPQYYAVTDDPLWDALRALARRAEASSQPQRD